jgi:hypothetical protein
MGGMDPGLHRKFIGAGAGGERSEAFRGVISLQLLLRQHC